MRIKPNKNVAVHLLCVWSLKADVVMNTKEVKRGLKSLWYQNRQISLSRLIYGRDQIDFCSIDVGSNRRVGKRSYKASAKKASSKISTMDKIQIECQNIKYFWRSNTLRDRSGVRLAGRKSFSVKRSALANYWIHNCTKIRIYFILYVVGIYIYIYVVC